MGPRAGWRGRVAALVVVVLGVAGCGQTAPVSRSRPALVILGAPRYQALWVDAFHDGIHSRQQIDQLVDTAARANVNTLIVQVRKAGDAYYRRSLEPAAWDIFAPPSFDPLGYLIQVAHRASPRIAIQAWVNTFYVGSNSHVYSQHGQDWANRRADGDAGPYLDPGNPAVRDYTHRVLMHLAENYDLDGLHLDFVRYPEGGDWGYSAAAVAAFNLAAGRSGPPDASDAVWQQWRRDQVTAFVRDLHTDLRARRPKELLTAALIPWGPGPVDDASWQRTRAYSEVFQDWAGWLRSGYLDLAVPMNYDEQWTRTGGAYFGQWTQWEKDQFGQRAIIGVGAYFNYPEDTLAQLRDALAPSPRGNSAAGAVIYSYASTSLYGTEDYWGDAQSAADLPRQPYGAGLDTTALAIRAGQFNQHFWSLLTQPGSYTDPALGPIPTQPAFTRPAPVPAHPASG
jgi:uncharacterized lipoprotein YddW (UPF0748 family)